MKLIFRCILALTAISFSMAVMTSRGHELRAQCCPSNTCTSSPPACPTPTCVYGGGCNYFWACNSPIVIDVRNEGFHLTDEAHGVYFRFYGDGKQHVAWTDPSYGNAWLALDRNGNGLIDDASELFGNDTAQPPSSDPNGFAALAVYDLPQNGGNGDGLITAADSIYPKLLLWTDQNHNGISERNELRTLAQAGIGNISLYYHLEHLKDDNGNYFVYGGRIAVNSTNYDHHIYDVYLAGSN